MHKHIRSLHTEDQYEKSVEEPKDLQKHLKTVDCNVKRTQTSDDPVIFMLKPGSKLNYGVNCENIRISTEDSTKFLCRVCLLSFKTEGQLKEHLTRHGTSIRTPSILKKC